VTTISYMANRTISSLRATLSFPLITLNHGTHSLKITVGFHKTVEGRTQTATKTTTSRFSVCAT
jgi:hypothetical protein